MWVWWHDAGGSDVAQYVIRRTGLTRHGNSSHSSSAAEVDQVHCKKGRIFI